MASEQFSLCWDNFHKNMSTGMQSLLETEDLVDVTLAVEGKCLKAHKMVLSLCSPYFREMFQSNPCKHPIVFMKDVSYVALSDLLHFMYQGEVQVSQENLSTFIKTAEALQIKGLTGDSGPQNDSESDAETEKTAPETVTKRAHEDGDPKSTSTPRTKRFSGPASKRPKFSSPVQTSTPVPAPVVATTGNRYEVASVNTNNVHETEDVDLKVEPHEATENSQPDTPEDNQLEQYADDTSAFEMTDETEDYSLIESTNDDPKPGPSTGTDGAENQVKMEVWTEEYLEEMKTNPMESLSEDVLEETKTNSLESLTEKSKKLYETIYKQFMDWRSSCNIDSFSEETFIQYFKGLSKKYKSSSLWTQYSMLRSTLKVYHSVSIEHYSKLRQFLKLAGEGYQAKTSKTFTPEDINRFINEAPDIIYLATKVAFIMGIVGACHKNELYSLTIDNIQDLGSVFLVTISKAANKRVRKFLITGNFYTICKKYIDLRPSNSPSPAFFLNYQKGKCTVQNIGKNKFGAMGKQVATFLKLTNPELYTGHSFRKSSATLLVTEDGDITALKKQGVWMTASTPTTQLKTT